MRIEMQELVLKNKSKILFSKAKISDIQKSALVPFPATEIKINLSGFLSQDGRQNSNNFTMKRAFHNEKNIT